MNNYAELFIKSVADKLPHQEYATSRNERITVNHKRRMTRSWKRHGKEGVVNYIMRYLKADSREWVETEAGKYL